MSSTNTLFPAASFVKAKLLREPVYREDGELWLTLRTQQDEIRHFFWQIGQELVVDEAEGYGFIRQIETESDDRVPRLVQRRALSYTATLLLVCLREEFLRFDTASGDLTRLVMTREELRNLIVAYLPETTNQVRDVARVDQGIKSLTDLGFLRPLSASDQDAFEVMRIVKARLGPSDLENIKQRLLSHAESRA